MKGHWSVIENIISVFPLLLMAIIVCFTVYRNLGGILASFGRYDRAKQILDRRIARNQRDWVALAQRASIEFTIGNYDAAINDYTAALDLDIEKTERWTIRKFGRSILLTERAQVQFAKGEYDAAQNDLLNAHHIKPTLHPTVAWLAIVTYASGQYTDAKNWWLQAIEMYPQYAKLTGNDWVKSVLGWHQPSKKAQEIIEQLNGN